MPPKRPVPALPPTALLLLAALLTPLAPPAPLPAAPPTTGVPVHYLVLETTADGFRPLFHRRVAVARRPRSTPAGPGDSTPPAAGTVRAELRVEGRTVFRRRVRVPAAVRGEHRADGGTRFPAVSPIVGHRHATAAAPFALRLPEVPDAALYLESAAATTVLPLAELVATAPGLPLAALAGIGGEGFSLGPQGDPANRFDLLVMGDGFRETDRELFRDAAADLVATFFDLSPYADYRGHVNASAVFTPSADGGADHPPYDADCSGDDPSCCSDPAALGDPLAGTWVETAFDGRFCSFMIHRLAVVDVAAVLAAASARPDWDRILVLLNDGTYGGSGGTLAVASSHPAAVEIAQHEMGHSFTDLADEYDTPYPGYPPCSDLEGPPCEANVTDLWEPALVKWSAWIDAATPLPTPEGDPRWSDAAGAFEGARYEREGLYRPRDAGCLMHFLGLPFGEVCAEAYVTRLYAGGWGVPEEGIDPIEPGSASPPPGEVPAQGPVALSAVLLEPAAGPPLAVEWTVDGVPLPGAREAALLFHPPGPGSWRVELVASDVTPLLRPDPEVGPPAGRRSWTIVVEEP